MSSEIFNESEAVYKQTNVTEYMRLSKKTLEINAKKQNRNV